MAKPKRYGVIKNISIDERHRTMLEALAAYWDLTEAATVRRLLRAGFEHEVLGRRQCPNERPCLCEEKHRDPVIFPTQAALTEWRNQECPDREPANYGPGETSKTETSSKSQSTDRPSAVSKTPKAGMKNVRSASRPTGTKPSAE